MKLNHYFSYRQICLLLAILVGNCFSSSAQIITTVAGNGAGGYSGDGGPATSAEIYYPWSVASDAAGGFYIGNYGYYCSGCTGARIRRINSSGIISTCAGTGTPGYSGDGGPATAAQIGGSTTTTYYTGNSLATDAAGNLYLTDFGNYRIRKVNTSGIISTIGGIGIPGYTGDGGPATAAEVGYSISYYYWDNGIASDPYGNIYFYCYGYNKIRKIDTAGIITTIAGTGGYGSAGDGGPATAATLGYIWGLCADGYGNVYMADEAFNKVRKINSSGIITTYAGNGGAGFSGDGGQATAAQTYLPSGVSIDAAGNLYICNYSNERVRKVNSSGIITTIAGTGTAGFSGDGGLATAAKLYEPIGTGVDADGNLYISDYANLRIRKITNYNRPPRFILRPWQNLTVCENSGPDSINALLSIRDSDLYQPESWAVLLPAAHGTVVCTYDTTSTGGVITPHGITYAPNTGYAGLDTFKMTICDGYVFDTIAIYVTVNPIPSAINGATSIAVTEYSLFSCSTAGGSWSSSNPGIVSIGATTGLATGISAGTAVITYTLPTGCINTTTVNVFPYAGMSIGTVAGNGTSGFSGDGGAALIAHLNNPYGVTEDVLGNFYIADTYNNRIRKVTPSGTITTIAGTGIPGSTGDGGAATLALLNGPISIVTDGNGNFYFSDQVNQKIRKINASGVISTIAGTGVAGFSGDGGNATAAQMNNPTGITMDAAGNIFIADQYNQRVRKVNTAGVISTVAGNGTSGFGGDGLAATAAELNTPDGVAVDGFGNVYIADFGNSRVREVSTSGIITTAAGSISGYGGDGSSAISAYLTSPFGIAVDALNNIYISDYSNNRIRKINTSGIISTIAGNGTTGFGGDACIATGGLLNNPSGLSIDGSGNVYIADRSNQRIRRISYNHAPKFNGGHVQSSSVCQNSTDSLSSLLSITDIDNGQGETWSALLGPLHGTLASYYIGTSTGGSVSPVGLYYAPFIGYTGLDSIRIVITDCSGGSDTTLIHITVTPPPSSIIGSATVCPGLTTTYTDPVGSGTWSSSNTSIAAVGTYSGIVTGTAAGVATISFSPGAGCSVTKIITVNPAPSAITGPLYVCQGQTVTLSDPTTGGTWSSSSTAIAGIVAGTGVASGVSLGTVTITYLQAGCIAIRTLSVNSVPGPIFGVSAVCAGANTVLTDTGTGVWSTGTPAIATVDSFTGLVTGVSLGTPTITYTLPGGCYTTDLLAITPIPSAILGPTTVCLGSTITMTDTPSAGIWSSGGISSSISIGSATGIVSGVSTGTGTITFTGSSGCYNTMTITVNSSPAAITGDSVVCAGLTTTLTDATGGGSWSSGTTAVATIVSTTGVVTGATSGSSIITYTSANGCTATDSINVYPMPATISGTATVCVGLTTDLTDVTPGGTWSSSSPAIGSVNATTGVVTGLVSGTTNIIYKLPSGCSVNMIVTVNSTPTVISGPNHVCLNSSVTLSDLTTGGIWTSSAPTVATVGSGSGSVTGLLTGAVTMTYSVGAGCSITLPMTVNPLPAVISGTPIVCVGSNITLTDATSGGTWSSSIPANGTISTGGILTGIATGISVIDYTLTSTTGCSRSVTASINPLPAVIGGPSTVCPGTTIALTETSSGGIWTSATGSIATIGTSGIVLGVASGTATISYTLSTGCARTKPVTVNPLPTAISGPSSVCAGSVITLTDVGGGGWSTSGTYATVGASSGLVTGASAGIAVITYMLSTGCYVTTNVTVNPVPASIGGPTALCVGATIALTDAGGGSWNSLAPSVATIGASSGIVTGVATGPATIVYSLPTGCTTATIVTVSTTPTAIAGPATVCAGGTSNLTDAITGGLWTSTNTGAATIGSLSGFVTGAATGVTTISYSLGTGCTVYKSVSVVPAPAAISGSSSICILATTPLTDGTTGGTWTSAPATIATISGTGVVSGVSAGVATIDYTVAGCAATKNVTVNTAPTAIAGPASVCSGSAIPETNTVTGGSWTTSASVLSVGSGSGMVSGISSGSGTITYSVGSCSVYRTINVNPLPSISGATGICTGHTGTLTASIAGGVWSSGVTTIATINPTTGLVTGIAPGTSTIIYLLTTGCSASVTETVNSAPTSITGTLSVCAGSNSALGDGATGGVWSISPVATATIGSSSGVVSGVVAGTATVSYSLGSGCNVSAVVTVNAVPSAISGATQVCALSSTTLTDGTTGGIWGSGIPTTATVSGGGLVTGVSAGTTNISYTVAGCSAVYAITVNPIPEPVSGLTSLCAGLTSSFTDMTTGGTWTCAPATIATIGTSGMVTGVIPGSATITYTLPTGCLITKALTINSAPPAIGGSSLVCIGSTIPLTDGTPGGTWSSTMPSVAAIGTSGIVTGMSTGTSVISYSVGGCPAIKTITVNSLPSAIAGPTIVCVTATVTATDAGGGIWSSSNPVVATVGSATGIITGVAAGTATILYSLGAGCTVNELITVNSLPSSIAGPATVCAGSAISLTDATAGGTWNSGTPVIASVSGTGVVTGLPGGGAAIISYTAPSGCVVTHGVSVISVAPISGVHNICAYGDTMNISDVPATGLFLSSLATVTNLGGGLGRVNGTTPGTATVTYMLPSGCIETTAFTVNPLPGLIGGSGHLCSGAAATLYDATPGGIWSTSGTGILTVGSLSGVVTGLSAGTAFVTYTLPSTGCKSDTTETINTMPAAITGSAGVFLGTPVTLSDAVAGGTWSSSNTAVATVVAGTGHVTGVTVGPATITYQTVGGCYVAKNISVMPSKSGGKEEGSQDINGLSNQVRVSPNPGDGTFTLELLWTTEEVVNITITNVAGVKISDFSTVTVKDGSKSVPLQLNVASGMYILTVTGGENRFTTKIIVNTK